MWFMNYIANPFVRLILRSPLHGWMSAAVMLITYRGRKTGREYTLPVQYVRDGQAIYIIPGMPERKTWWRSLRGGQPVRLRLAGETLDARAEAIDGSSDPDLAARVLEQYFRRFPPSARQHKVRVSGDGAFAPADLQRAAQSMVLVRVELSKD
jgi:deazaflavin-dependent oxidoreductase (nitroreductase family)